MLSIEYLKDKLEQIQKVTGAYVCIAGGAPRDLLNNKSINDIDCFIQYVYNDNIAYIINILQDDLGFITSLLAKPKTEGYATNHVYEGNHEEHKWQFVFIEEEKPSDITEFAKDVLNSFDYHLCQIAIRPYTNILLRTEEYETDVLNKTLTANPDIPYKFFQTEKAKARLTKLLKKYPEHRHIPLPEPEHVRQHITPLEFVPQQLDANEILRTRRVTRIIETNDILQPMPQNFFITNGTT